MPISPTSHHERCGDIVEYMALLRGPWELDYEQLSRRQLTAENTGVSTGSSVIYTECFNRCVAVRGALRPGLLAFSLPSRRSRSGRWWGEAPSRTLRRAPHQGERVAVFSNFKRSHFPDGQGEQRL